MKNRLLLPLGCILLSLVYAIIFKGVEKTSLQDKNELTEQLEAYRDTLERLRRKEYSKVVDSIGGIYDFSSVYSAGFQDGVRHTEEFWIKMHRQ